MSRRIVYITNIPDKVDMCKELKDRLWDTLKVADDEKMGRTKDAGYGALSFVIAKRAWVQRIREFIHWHSGFHETWTIDYRELEEDCLGG